MPRITPENRVIIERMLKRNYNQSQIAEIIGVHQSSVSREIKRNKDRRSVTLYKHGQANKKAYIKESTRPRHKKLTSSLKEQINELLEQKLSPEQIAGHLKVTGQHWVSHETIYQYVWRNKRSRGKLYKHLRRQGRKYQSRGHGKKSRGIIKDRVDIDLRPTVVEQRHRFGDLEIDTVISKGQKQVFVTINDRASGLCWIKKLRNRRAENVAKATIQMLRPYKGLIKTITADNGKEFSQHKAIAEALELDFYFAKPYCSWQRGSNENLNGLIRQFAPKKTSFAMLTKQDVQAIQNNLNSRPRKRYGYRNPNFVAQQLIRNPNYALVT